MVTQSQYKSTCSSTSKINLPTVSMTSLSKLSIGTQQKDYPLSLSVSRLIEVPTQGSPQPYKQHQITASTNPNADTDYRLDINVKFD
jgi:hypothetical protein